MFNLNSAQTATVLVLAILSAWFTVNNLITEIAKTRRVKHHSRAVERGRVCEPVPYADGEDLDENAEVPA